MLFLRTITILVISFLISSCPCHYVFGQEIEMELTGFLSDSISGEPIENVNISIKDSKKGTITDPMGKFTLEFKKLPLIIEITHIGYEPKTVRFDFEPLTEQKITLKQKTEELSEITISSKLIDTLFHDNHYSVLDYELSHEGIMLLIYRYRLSRSELMLMDYSGNTLLELNVLPMKPLTLYKDCLGKIHIFSRSRTYEIFIDTNKLILYDPYELDHFKDVMSGCMFRKDGKVYFEDYEFYDLIKKYYYVNIEDTNSHLLTQVIDTDKIDFLKNNPENYLLPKEGGDEFSNLNGVTSDRIILDNIRNLSTTLRFNKMAYLSKIYAPIFAMHDTISIFNHPNDRIEFYNTSDSLLGITGIDYHLEQDEENKSNLVYAFAKSSKWLQQIFVDEVENRAYTIYQNLNGTKKLEEINLKTGETTFRLNIPYAYVQKVKVRDNFVYFVYKGYEAGSKKKLFRQKIN